jgi:hypothetical protein
MVPFFSVLATSISHRIENELGADNPKERRQSFAESKRNIQISLRKDLSGSKKAKYNHMLMAVSNILASFMFNGDRTTLDTIYLTPRDLSACKNLTSHGITKGSTLASRTCISSYHYREHTCAS